MSPATHHEPYNSRVMGAPQKSGGHSKKFFPAICASPTFEMLQAPLIRKECWNKVCKDWCQNSMLLFMQLLYSCHCKYLLLPSSLSQFLCTCRAWCVMEPFFYSVRLTLRRWRQKDKARCLELANVINSHSFAFTRLLTESECLKAFSFHSSLFVSTTDFVTSW